MRRKRSGPLESLPLATGARLKCVYGTRGRRGGQRKGEHVRLKKGMTKCGTFFTTGPPPNPRRHTLPCCTRQCAQRTVCVTRMGCHAPPALGPSSLPCRAPCLHLRLPCSPCKVHRSFGTKQHDKPRLRLTCLRNLRGPGGAPLAEHRLHTLSRDGELQGAGDTCKVCVRVWSSQTSRVVDSIQTIPEAMEGPRWGGAAVRSRGVGAAG